MLFKKQLLQGKPYIWHVVTVVCNQNVTFKNQLLVLCTDRTHYN